MTTVYLVSSGSYSDYHVHGVYSTRKKAQARARITSDANEIEEYELDEAADALEQGLSTWMVSFQEDGTVRSYQTEYSVSQAVNQPIDDYRKKKQVGARCDLAVHVFARDEAHALKIAQDKRAEYLAKEAGV